MSATALAVLSPYFTAGAIDLTQKTFLWNNVWLVDIPGTYPSIFTAPANFFLSLGLILFLLFVKRKKNIAIYFIFPMGINLISALFFIFSPANFPYTAADFAELYIKSQISMWLFIPVILGMAFLPLPASIVPKLALISITLLYSSVFGTLRYIIFLFIISKLSVMHMALLFFSFGPLIDFVYIVGIYCFYISRLSGKLKGNKTVWRWSY